MPTVSANGVELYYEVRGVGMPLLGIHGTPSSAVLWVDSAEELAKLGRCIIYDRRGFSRSGRPDPFDSVDLSDHVNDAVALLHALSATPAVVIGRSTGGEIALDLARRFPAAVKALILLEPAVFTVDPEAAAWAQRLRLKVLEAAAQDPTSAAQAVFRMALGDSSCESLPADLKELLAAESPAVLAELRGQGLDLSAHPLDLSTEEIAGIGQPTLILSSEDSPQVFRLLNDRLAERLPHAEKVLVRGGHLINPAHPAVVDFVRRLMPAA
jgi:pimeloyl-ACP methyl ester carboxylesterase